MALVHTSEAQLERVSRLQNDTDNGVYVQAEFVHDICFPKFAVYFGFQQALNNAGDDR